MTSTRIARVAVAPAMAASLLLAGCGGAATTAEGTSTSAATSGSATSGSAATAAAVTCPTDNTRAFAKTRFVADLGLTAGTFHRWIYKPYIEGKFTKGADGRTGAIVKAAATAALDVKLLKNATENVKADPQLCNALAEPMTRLTTKLDQVKGDLTSGDLTSIAGAEAIVQEILSGSKKAGLSVTETTQQ
ncbi:MAG: hypothetical protein LWW86_15680 [Micrococcales bacterium]|nr:hypothetical protein [Micrococcales bacterium]